MCKINPKVDFAFKKLFGSEENKDLTISLINAIVTERDQVEDIEFLNPYNLQDFMKDKLSVVDVKAKRKSDHQYYNIEMQIGEDRRYSKRAMYYWSKMVVEHMGEGDRYHEIPRTISINLLDFTLTPHQEYHNSYHIVNKRTKEQDFGEDEIFEMHLIEMPKFKKGFDEISTALDRWVAFLNYASRLEVDKLPKQLHTPDIEKATSSVSRMFDSEERKVYDVRRKTQMDYEAILDSAVQKGVEKGIGIGKAEGIEEGEKRKALEVAKNFKKDGIPLEIIAKNTGLSIEEIKAL